MKQYAIYGQIGLYCIFAVLLGLATFHSYHLGIHVMIGSASFAVFICFLLDIMPILWVIYYRTAATTKIELALSSTVASIDMCITLAAVGCNMLYTSDLQIAPAGLGATLNGIVIFSFIINSVAIFIIKMTSGGNGQSQKYFE